MNKYVLIMLWQKYQVFCETDTGDVHSAVRFLKWLAEHLDQ